MKNHFAKLYIKLNENLHFFHFFSKLVNKILNYYYFFLNLRLVSFFLQNQLRIQNFESMMT
jgi:hypothetical protein